MSRVDYIQRIEVCLAFNVEYNTALDVCASNWRVMPKDGNRVKVYGTKYLLKKCHSPCGYIQSWLDSKVSASTCCLI